MTSEVRQAEAAGGTAQERAVSRVIDLAWRAPFYRRRWRRPPSSSGLAALSTLPVITPEDWHAAGRRNPGELLAGLPALWTLARLQGRDVWFPAAHRDLTAATVHAAAAMRQAGVGDGDRILAVLPAAPSAWNALPYLLLQSDLAVECLVLSIETVTFKPSLAAFPIARRPTVFLASEASAAELTRLAGPLPPIALRIVCGDMGDVKNAGLIGLAGCLAPIGRCASGAWHLPVSAALAEILPGADILPGESDSRTRPHEPPHVQRLADAPAGERGRLVLTTFTHAAPLVRFATGLRIRAPGPAPCACGDPNPWMLLDRG